MLSVHDVIVIGAGPVGSYTAGRLAAMGHKVLVLERKERLDEPVCCSGIISEECVRSFAISESVILRRINGATFFSPSKSLHIGLRQKNQACIVDRPALNLLLAQRAQQNGAEYLPGSLVKEVKAGEGGVRVMAVRGGEELTFEAKAAVVADGFRSGLASMLGLGKVSDFIVGAQAEVSTNDLNEIEVYFNQEVAPGFFAWLVPTSPAKALVGLAVRHNPGLYLKKLISSLQAQGKIVSTDAEILYRGIPLKPLTKTCGNRVIVVGDAVGQVKPTTGGGIYYGLLCADIAAGTLHQALERNILSARSLAGYERGWRKKLGQELRLCYWARKFYRRLSDRQIDRIFDIIISNEIDKALLDMDDLSFDWHGEILLRVLKQQTWLKAINAVLKVPFRIGAD